MPDHEIVHARRPHRRRQPDERTPRFCFGPDSPVLDEVREAAAALRPEAAHVWRRARDRHDQRRTRLKSNPVTRAVRAARSLGQALGGEVRPRRHLRPRRGSHRTLPRGALRVRRPRLRQRSPAPDRLHHDQRAARAATSSTCCCGSASSPHPHAAAARSTREPTRSRARCSITGQEGLATFCAESASSARQRRSRACVAGLRRVRPGTNVDTVRPTSGTLVARGEGRPAWADGQRRHGRSAQPQLARRHRAASRDRSIGELARGDRRDDGWQRSPSRTCWWDEVASIEPIGEQETFDITVPGDHNFVADDVVVHNSALVTNMAENVALNKDNRRPVALFSLEMSEAELAQRFIASQASIKGDDLRKGRLRDEAQVEARAADRRRVRRGAAVRRRLLGHRDHGRARQGAAAAPAGDGRVRRPGAGHRRLPAAHARRLAHREPRAAGRRDEPRAEDPRARAQRAGHRASASSRAASSRGPTSARCSPTCANRARSSRTPTSSCSSTATSTTSPRPPTSPGEAELIIAKHRNGGLGDVPLTFQNEYPRFLGLQRAA